MRCATAVAQDSSNEIASKAMPEETCTKIVENEIDKMEESLPGLGKFILPGGSDPVSYCHIARCVCRRAERSIAKLKEEEEFPQIVLRFLNRLSDYLFVLSRKISLELDNEEIIWSV